MLCLFTFFTQKKYKCHFRQGKKNKSINHQNNLQKKDAFVGIVDQTCRLQVVSFTQGKRSEVVILLLKTSFISQQSAILKSEKAG